MEEVREEKVEEVSTAPPKKKRVKIKRWIRYAVKEECVDDPYGPLD